MSKKAEAVTGNSQTTAHLASSGCLRQLDSCFFSRGTHRTSTPENLKKKIVMANCNNAGMILHGQPPILILFPMCSLSLSPSLISPPLCLSFLQSTLTDRSNAKTKPSNAILPLDTSSAKIHVSWILYIHLMLLIWQYFCHHHPQPIQLPGSLYWPSKSLAMKAQT